MAMKTLLKKLGDLALAGRWDIDFHLPPEEITKFPERLVKRVDEVASISKIKRDPTKKPERLFQYVDITSLDVSTGVIVQPQELTGEEAPSRARKVIRAYDVIVSTCRPTRGAIAVIPEWLHNQIASTAYSIVRAERGVNPFYLHFALRLPSTLEQFRKWSTGSSYPAILDEDVRKTRIPVPDPDTQDHIARKVLAALREREAVVETANAAWSGALTDVTNLLMNGVSGEHCSVGDDFQDGACSIAEIEAKLTELPLIENDDGPIGLPLFPGL